MMKRYTILKASLVFTLLLLLTQCASVKQKLAKKAIGDGVKSYLAHQAGESLDSVANNIWSFRQGFERNLMISYDSGLVVIDPFNMEMSKSLAKVIEDKFPGKKVTHLIYSHYHLDHTQGGEYLNPEKVLGHEDCNKYWNDFDTKNVLPLTEVLRSQDYEFQFGTTKMQMLWLDESHSNTLYAFYFPEQGVVYGPDLAFMKAFPPAGMPHAYFPGIFRALEKVKKLDFDTFVPSHLSIGSKQDYVDYYEMLKLVRDRTREELADSKHGLEKESERFVKSFNKINVELEEKYPDWHGFDFMRFQLVIRLGVGQALGY